MDSLELTILLLSFALCVCIYILKVNPKKKLPPGPKPYPIIGNILEFGQKPHESLAKLSKTYGPLMTLKLGSITTIVASTPETAKLVLQTYDQFFSSRYHPNVIHALDHHILSMGWMPVNDKWRMLRRICKERMFSTPRLDANEGMRMEKLQNLWNYVNKCCLRGDVVDMGEASFTTSLNLISSSLFSLDFAEFGSDSSHELKHIVMGIMELLGKPNFADHFPILRRFDPQGILRENTVYFKKCFMKFDEMIDQRLQAKESRDYTPKSDMLEALLELNQKEENELSFDDIKHLLLDLFMAGTDTTSVQMEWVMTELLRNPDKMVKAQKEVRNAIPQNERVEESDISRLPYLRAVIKETFRFHPTVPFLLPHKNEEDVEMYGYAIPKNTQVLINIWAISRDSSIWADPDVFMPERFLEQDIDYTGQHFELIPFSAGRRICPGMPLAYRMMHLMVATMIHNFDWKLENGLQPGQIDMTEKSGATLQKAIPVKAIPIKVK